MPDDQIRSFFQNEKDIIAIYLFGSYASGKIRSDSDIDLAILFDSRDPLVVNQMLDKYLMELSRILRKDVHLTAMNFASETLLKQIYTNGRCLLVRDSKKLAYFTMTAYSKIVHFRYYQHQMQSGMVRRVTEGI